MELVYKVENYYIQAYKIEMIRKKNYKQQDHYTQYYTFSIPLQTGKKVLVYYKRYRPKLTSTDKVVQIYDLINSKNKNQKEQMQKMKSPYPVDRSLEIMTFDQDLKGKIQPIMKKVGKVRKFEFGKGQFKSREVFFCIVIFKYQFDLVKCFRQEFIQAIIQQEFKIHQKEEDKDDYRAQIIQKYLKKQLQSKNKKIKQLHDEGYNLITNKMGQFKIDRQNNEKWVQDLPQIKRKKREHQVHRDKANTKQE